MGTNFVGKLTATGVKALKAAGRYGDGDGLYLIVKPTGSKSWVVRVQKGGERRDIGLGSESKVTLADARKRASTARCQIEAGLDPVAERKKAEGIPTFRQAAVLVHGENLKAWKNGKHNKQWITSLETYAFPFIGDKSLSDIEASDVRDLLAPIWLEKHETARRVRQRIGTILDWAHAKGYRPAEAPMSAINRGLPKYKPKAGHFAAMPYRAVPDFSSKIATQTSWGALALHFTILTAARSGEVRGARWEEFDLEAGLWTVPGERMKAGVTHVVPLSAAALEVLTTARKRKRFAASSLVFEGAKSDTPMSDATMAKALAVAGGGDATVHGFRSSFRDWASEETHFTREVCEQAIAHTIANKTEAAYRRGNLLEKRRELMAVWADYCHPKPEKVIRLVKA